MKEKNLSIIARVALLVATLIWGSSFIIVKDVVDVLPPNLLLAIRFTVGCVLLSVIFFKKLKRINRTYLWQGALIGGLLFAAYCTQTIGITDTTPGKNAFLTAVYCVIVPFLFWAVSKKRPDRYNVVAALICITGIGLVSLTENLTIGFGDGLTLVGGFFYAAHIVAVAKFGGDKDPVLITILQFGYSAIYAAVISLIFEQPLPAIHWNTELIFSVGYLGVLCTGAALLLQNFGQKFTSPASASIILSLESVFGVAFSLLLYPDEKMTLRIGTGFVLIFVAVLISETKLAFLKGLFCAKKTTKE